MLELMEPRQLLSAVPTLDTTFNTTGEVLDNWAGGVYATVTAVSVLPSGQIIAVGQGIPSGGDHQELFVARFNNDGTPDNTFNTGAGTNYRFYDPFGEGSSDYANDLLLLSDGSFIVSGTSTVSGVGAGYLFKFDADGSLDTSFGTDGSYTDPVQNIATVVPQGNDLLIGGEASTTQFAVSRLTATGQLDTTFGTNGRVIFTASPASTESPSEEDPGGLLGVRDDGSFVFSGIIAPLGSEVGRSGFVANFSANGTPAAAFGSNSGQIIISYGGDDAIYATLQPDGSLLTNDYQFAAGTTSVTYYLGTVSTAGVQSTPVDVGTEPLPGTGTKQWSEGTPVSTSNGQLILPASTSSGDTGGLYNTNGYQADIWRVTSAVGALDPTFGTNGDYPIATSGAGLFPFNSTITPDGKLLICGFANVGGSTYSIMLARYNISTGTGVISGSVYHDANLNGVEDPGEALADVPVYIDETNAGQYVSGDPITTTNVFGDYSLSGLAPGTYTVRVDTALLPNLGTELPASGYYTSTVANGQTVSGDNFALKSEVTATIHQVLPNPHTGGVSSISITFSEGVTGFTLNSLSLQDDDSSSNLLHSAPVTLNGSGASYTLNGLTNITDLSSSFTLTFTASGSGVVGVDGTTDVSNASMTWTAITGTPSVASDFTAIAQTKHSVLLSWENPTNDQLTATAPTYVVILRSLDKHFKTGVERVKITSASPLTLPTTYAAGGMRAGTRYYYRIYEGNKYGLSTFTTAVSILGSGLEVNYVSTLMSEAQEQAFRATL
jgi:uncharacterized delta-60 repeat protein